MNTLQRVLVTGADGFIGSHLVERLLETEWKLQLSVSTTRPDHSDGWRKFREFAIESTSNSAISVIPSSLTTSSRITPPYFTWLP
jgi:nucleoside-diphosphate-sugar epimerase